MVSSCLGIIYIVLDECKERFDQEIEVLRFIHRVLIVDKAGFGDVGVVVI